ncbi:unnamed protein product, partial [marine sediment metagenome]
VHIKQVLDKYFEVPPAPEAEGYQPIPHALAGLSGLDDFLGGFQRSDLVIIAGRPSMGGGDIRVCPVADVGDSFSGRNQLAHY